MYKALVVLGSSIDTTKASSLSVYSNDDGIYDDKPTLASTRLRRKRISSTLPFASSARRAASSATRRASCAVRAASSASRTRRSASPTRRSWTRRKATTSRSPYAARVVTFAEMDPCALASESRRFVDGAAELFDPVESDRLLCSPTPWRARANGCDAGNGPLFAGGSADDVASNATGGGVLLITSGSGMRARGFGGGTGGVGDTGRSWASAARGVRSARSPKSGSWSRWVRSGRASRGAAGAGVRSGIASIVADFGVRSGMVCGVRSGISRGVRSGMSRGVRSGMVVLENNRWSMNPRSGFSCALGGVGGRGAGTEGGVDSVAADGVGGVIDGVEGEVDGVDDGTDRSGECECATDAEEVELADAWRRARPAERPIESGGTGGDGAADVGSEDVGSELRGTWRYADGPGRGSNSGSGGLPCNEAVEDELGGEGRLGVPAACTFGMSGTGPGLGPRASGDEWRDEESQLADVLGGEGEPERGKGGGNA